MQGLNEPCNKINVVNRTKKKIIIHNYIKTILGFKLIKRKSQGYFAWKNVFTCEKN